MFTQQNATISTTSIPWLVLQHCMQMNRENKSLADLIYKTGITETSGTTHREIATVVSDSRKATEGSLFVAIRGLTNDGHLHIDQAISLGAKAILCETLPGSLNDEVTYVRVRDTRKALGIVAANFFDHPSRRLKLIGVTGTNGKTTVVRMLHEVFSKLGNRCGMISTISNVVAGREVPTEYTTPDPLTINQLLADMAAAKCTHAFIEVSSHALAQARVEALHFAGAVFTNLTHDHLDYHKNFREYLKSKQLLFNKLETKSFALTNLDDKNGMIVTQNTKGKIWTYSLRAMADFKGKLLEKSLNGLHLQIDKRDVWCKLTGTFNAYNIMAVYGVGRILDKPADSLLSAISNCAPPKGRFDFFIGDNKVIGIVDYAHTPDALKNVLETIKEVRTGNEKLITVIGCGGNRDRSKRGPMAAVAASHSDKVIFTSDNPRHEDPETIIEEMMQGLQLNPGLKPKAIKITNRQEAINVACVMASEGDIILVAGKGHEKYQEIKGVKYPFDDKAILQKLLNR